MFTNKMVESKKVCYVRRQQKKKSGEVVDLPTLYSLFKYTNNAATSTVGTNNNNEMCESSELNLCGVPFSSSTPHYRPRRSKSQLKYEDRRKPHRSRGCDAKKFNLANGPEIICKCLFRLFGRWILCSRRYGLFFYFFFSRSISFTHSIYLFVLFCTKTHTDTHSQRKKKNIYKYCPHECELLLQRAHCAQQTD